MVSSGFLYHHHVHFYETDLMGIVHHSNYLRIFEEARVAWAHDRGLLNYQDPKSAFQLAVVETNVRHLKPARFGDRVVVDVRVQGSGVRMTFAYRMRLPSRADEVLAIGKTVHAALDHDLKLMRPPRELQNLLKQEIERFPWTETWLLNL